VFAPPLLLRAALQRATTERKAACTLSSSSNSILTIVSSGFRVAKYSRRLSATLRQASTVFLRASNRARAGTVEHEPRLHLE
jgi:hypothetical protein